MTPYFISKLIILETNEVNVNSIGQSILELSNEIDVLQQENSHSELQSAEKMRHLINMERESLSSRIQMEMQIIDALSAHGLGKDGVLIKVCALRTGCLSSLLLALRFIDDFINDSQRFMYLILPR